jgi:hypothetical protein
MGKLFSDFALWLQPVIALATGAIGLVTFLAAGLADPSGWCNSIICTVIDHISSVFPSTPSNLTIASFVQSVAGALPQFGMSVIYDIMSTIASIMALSLVIKIYKLIPFKAT